jgi:DNA-binding Lrp family transcriptional regulator
MGLHKYLERIRFIDSLVKKRATGNYASLAKKLNLSKTELYNFLNEMKTEGIPISYSKKLNSFYYTEEGSATTKLYEREVTKEEMKSIKGGNGFFTFFHFPLIVEID